MKKLIESNKKVDGINIAFDLDTKKEVYIVDSTKGHDELRGNFRPEIYHGANVIYGKRGSGKTTYCRFLIDSYHEQYPKNAVILISSHKKEDEVAFKGLKYIKQLVITPEVLDGLNVCEEFRNCLLVIDDPHAMPTKKECDFVGKIIHDVLYNSRKYNVKCVITNHKVLDGSRNKSTNYEADSFTFFVASRTAWREIEVFCTKYLGLDKEAIEKIKHTKSRWVTISNVVPTYIMTENEIEML